MTTAAGKSTGRDTLFYETELTSPQTSLLLDGVARHQGPLGPGALSGRSLIKKAWDVFSVENIVLRVYSKCRRADARWPIYVGVRV
jgi:hypothetical protein